MKVCIYSINVGQVIYIFHYPFFHQNLFWEKVSTVYITRFSKSNMIKIHIILALILALVFIFQYIFSY